MIQNSLNMGISHFLHERVSEQVSAGERASSAEQANKRVLKVTERADERVAQYRRPDFKRSFCSYQVMQVFRLVKDLLRFF